MKEEPQWVAIPFLSSYCCRFTILQQSAYDITYSTYLVLNTVYLNKEKCNNAFITLHINGYVRKWDIMLRLQVIFDLLWDHVNHGAVSRRIFVADLCFYRDLRSLPWCFAVPVGISLVPPHVGFGCYLGHIRRVVSPSKCPISVDAGRWWLFTSCDQHPISKKRNWAVRNIHGPT